MLSCAARAVLDPSPSPTFPHSFPYGAVYGVQVHCPKDPPAGARGGTAFAIGPHELLTAKHVVFCEGDPPDSVLIKHIDSGTIYTVSVKKMGEKCDVASLQVKEWLPDWLEVHLQPIARGAPLCFVTARNFTKCGYAFSNSAQPFVGIAVPAVAGNSGSPVLDVGGHVVAVVIGTTEIDVDHGQEAATFSISAEHWFPDLM